MEALYLDLVISTLTDKKLYDLKLHYLQKILMLPLKQRTQ